MMLIAQIAVALLIVLVIICLYEFILYHIITALEKLGILR